MCLRSGGAERLEHGSLQAAGDLVLQRVERAAEVAARRDRREPG